jgi:hypothetical protein
LLIFKAVLTERVESTSGRSPDEFSTFPQGTSRRRSSNGTNHILRIFSTTLGEGTELVTMLLCDLQTHAHCQVGKLYFSLFIHILSSIYPTALC